MYNMLSFKFYVNERTKLLKIKSARKKVLYWLKDATILTKCDAMTVICSWKVLHCAKLKIRAFITAQPTIVLIIKHSKKSYFV